MTSHDPPPATASAATARLVLLLADGPDEMGRELAGGPAAVEATLANAARLRPIVDRARAAARRVVLVGTGASLAVARASEPWFRSTAATGVPVIVRESALAVLGAPDGEAFRAGDLVVAISQSGASPETVAAAAFARRAGATTLAVSAEPDAPLASAADAVLHTPSGPESGAATKSELAALAGLGALAGVLPADRSNRADLRRRLDAVCGDHAGAMAAGLAFGLAGRAWLLGFGSSRGLASAAAMLFHEKALLPAIAQTPSAFRHAAIEMVTPADAVLVVEVDPADARRSAYLARLADELAVIGVPLVGLGTVPVPVGAIGMAIDGPPGPVAAVLALLRVQQVARVAAHARGTYRDGFRVLRRIVHPVDDLLSG